MSEVPQPLHALPQGYRLQEYELVRVLGFGGFGMTYLGFDHNLDLSHRGNPRSDYGLCLSTPIGYISLHPLFPLDERRGWLNLIVFPSRF